MVINDSIFIGSDLTDSVVQGDILESSAFAKCILTRTDFSGTKFKGRLWSQPSFLRAKAKNANFSKCKMYFVDMSKADLENADFSHSNIELIDAQSANLKGVNFTHSNLNGLNLGHTDLTNADFSDSIIVDSFILRDTILTGTKFNNMTLFQNPEIILNDTIYEGKGLPLEGRTTKVRAPAGKKN